MIEPKTTKVFKATDILIDHALEHCDSIYDILIELRNISYENNPKEYYNAINKILSKPGRFTMLYHTNLCMMIMHDLCDTVMWALPDSVEDKCKIARDNGRALGRRAFELWSSSTIVNDITEEDKFDIGVKLDELESAYSDFVISLTKITEGKDYSLLRSVTYVLFGNLKVAE